MDDCKSEDNPKFNTLEAFRGKGPCLNPLFNLQGQILPEFQYFVVLYPRFFLKGSDYIKAKEEENAHFLFLLFSY